ncbi:hypothetical protein SSX86_019339 [Deinandra increscens subsp. villosa]|uniref:Transposase n=1 Tax=Deinandra increscens subsp. villosa TaxID=3103831 RepID=A0AAP0CZL8_9ASTR
MDKSWMSLGRLSKEYDEGVNAFLEFAQSNNPKSDVIPCPCVNCINLRPGSITSVRFHLFANGFDENYTVWSFHGEGSPKVEVRCPDESRLPEFDYTKEMLHDAFAYVEKEPDSLKSLLEECDKPLYEGSKHNALSGLMIFQKLKGQFGWSDTSFNALLSALKTVLPAKNTIPSSMYEAKKLLKGIGLEYEKIHACENDCVLFWNEHKDASECPTCGTSRWKKNTKNVPRKVLWYFPPIPRFRRMFSSPEIAHDLTWHAQGKVIDGKLTHPRDSPSWKLVDNTWKEFGRENRNLRLALSADGINPHKSLSSKHSCWPVTLITYNLPSYLCMSRKFIMLTLLISGPKQPGNNIDVYLAPLIADLKLLWETGVRTFDAYKKEYFNLRAVLLWTINDFPAYGNLSGCVTKGYNACPICSDNTCSQWLPKSRKVCFLGHRRFLSPKHPLRKRKKDFNNEQENDVPKKPLSGEEIYEHLAGFQNTWGQKIKSKTEKSKKKSSKKKKEIIDERAKFWHKKSIFFELEYWKKLLVRHQLDVMHIEKNVCESVYGTLLNLPNKTKDGLKARQDLEDLGIKPELQTQVKGNRLYLPPAIYTLNSSEKHQFYDTLSNIKVPDGYSSNFKNLVSDDVSKMNGLKSNDCHVLMQQLLPFAIKGVLNVKVRKTIIDLCHFFNELCSKVVDVSKLSKLQSNIVSTLCLLEKYFPPSFFDVMIHLMVHLVREVRLCGPVHFRWMYPFERFMKILKGYVRNHHRPEGCIAECYVAEEALEFWSTYLKNGGSIGNPHERDDERIRTGKPLSGAKVDVVDTKILDEAHLYVLRNTAAVETYTEQHMLELKDLNPRRTSTWLHNQHSRTFISWFKNEVEKRLANGEDICDSVRWLAKGPNFVVNKYSGFSINGYKFHTTSRDESRTTQCSGVSIVAHTMQIASAKDSNPVYGAVTYYGRIKEIWEIDYRMFTIPVFMCDWVDSRGVKKDDFGFTVVNFGRLGNQSERFILASQARQVFYVQDQQDRNLSVVGFTPHKMYKYGDDDEIDDMFEFDTPVDVEDPTLADLDDDFNCTRSDDEGILV